MKKLTLILIAVLFGFISFSQNTEFDEITLKENLKQYTTAGGLQDLIIVNTDGTASIKNITDPVDGNDAVNLDYLNSLPLTGWDSLYFNSGNGDIEWYSGGSPLGSINMNDYFAVGDLNDYIPWADTVTTIVTVSQLSDSLVAAAPKGTFTITLPSASTVSDRIAGATEVPPGWILTADGLNIDIGHNLGRYSNSVAVFATTTAPANQRLDGTAAENGLVNIDTNNTKILSLATIQKEIRIFISFTQ